MSETYRGEAHRLQEEMRNDPARKAAINDRITEIQDAFANAHDLLRQARAALDTAVGNDLIADPLTARCLDALSSTLHRFDGDARFVMAEPTDAYVGNKACQGLPRGYEPEPA